MTRPREEWRRDVAARYKALEQFAKEDARLHFLRILRSLPYGARVPWVPYVSREHARHYAERQLGTADEARPWLKDDADAKLPAFAYCSLITYMAW